MAFKECFATIRSSGVDGRGLFATRDIKPGEPIFTKSRPLTATANFALWDSVCTNCFKGEYTPIFSFDANGAPLSREDLGPPKLKRCTKCKLVAYCGQKCQAEHWERSHKYMCKKPYLEVLGAVINTYSKEGFPSILPSMIELIVMREKEIISEQEWESILQLQSHFQEMENTKRYQDKRDLPKAAALAMKNSRYKDIIPRLMATLMTNSFELVSPTSDPIGFCFDPFASIANHSCAPNAYTVMDGPELSFRSLKLIRKDEEIFLSYIDRTEPRSFRRQELKERYFFDCNCSRCAASSNPSEDQTPDPSPSALKSLIKEIENSKNFEDRQLGYQVPSKINEQNIKECLDTLNRFQLKLARAASEPARSKFLQYILFRCKDSGICSPTRQPWPEVSHEVLLANIDQRDWPNALLNAIKLYVDIAPVLYPEPFHPLRVVGCWRLYRISNEFLVDAGDNQQYQNIITGLAKEGVKLRALMGKMLREAQVQSRQSHGSHSTFSQVLSNELKGFINLDKAISAQHGPAVASGVDDPAAMETLEKGLQHVAKGIEV